MLLAHSAMAIENPVQEESAQGNARAKGFKVLPGSSNSIDRLKSSERDAQKAPLKGRKVAVLGLRGAAISPSLASHLNIKDNSGLTVTYVDPESAAAKAGLQAHDVILSFDGQPIGSQESLKDAILSRKPGDEATISYIHQAKVIEKKVALGGRIVMFEGRSQQRPDFQPQQNGYGNLSPVDRQHIDDRMQKRMQMMQDQLSNSGIDQQLLNLLNLPSIMGSDSAYQGGAANGQSGSGQIKIDLPEGSHINFRSSVTIRHQDSEGAVTEKTENGIKTIIVHDNRGKVVYEGPYSTAEHKEAVPQEIKHRLQALGLDDTKSSGYRIHMPDSSRQSGSR